ncbi:hypothetical protein D3C78_552920 [compost metagenome]
MRLRRVASASDCSAVRLTCSHNSMALRPAVFGEEVSHSAPVVGPSRNWICAGWQMVKVVICARSTAG